MVNKYNYVLHTPFSIGNANTHTMGSSLIKYVEMKVHEFSFSWDYGK